MLTRKLCFSLTLLLLACSSQGDGDSNGSAGAGDTPDGIGDGEIPGAGAGMASGPASRDSSGATSAGGEILADGASAGGAAGTSATTIGEPIDGEPIEPTEPAVTIEPGTLTAGTWDDNRNFDRFMGYRSELYELNVPGLLPLSEADHQAAHDVWSNPPGPKQTLDVSLVIDTTGSMSDELSYLQTEFLAISSAIEATYPQSDQRWSLVVYRDTGDEYVARWFDFRSSAEEFRTHLAEQSANGGGDFPEAPDAAFEKMNQLAWRADADTARLAFWVADAPHHEQNAQVLADAFEQARAQDVHIYPVASSGIDELTELTMRSAAQLTGGRYLFLTDDSGVGGVHKEPSIPCYFVTKLDSAILRMVDIELSGTYREPDPEEIIRTGGDPEDGACTLSSGETVLAF